ncbi:uncharacterized protein LOC129619151 [Condylostylus longicornis]|uniref:uncharacterized protein LOC129619151 n=1 Tax=Condylostylus longicornis TaxID=2530218 RepID=UPI00244DA158|nr:uncharacterized protein LOC129619151 [Condylostylus longicornis]
MKKRCYVKIILELHGVTCPGVWLCTSGYLELTIKTLGYFFKSGPMEPKFPMLCHDVFIMEGYFPSVRNFNELDKVLATENIEASLWQNGCRLAYFIGKIKQIICNSYVENSTIQILMNPSHNFPGIIAPKLELVSYVFFENRTQLDEIQHTCNKFIQMKQNEYNFVPNKTIQTEPDKRSLEARIQRQVCHTKNGRKHNFEKSNPDWRFFDSSRKSSKNVDYKNNERRSNDPTVESVPSLKLLESSRNSSTDTGSTSGQSNQSLEMQHSGKTSTRHSENCDICRTYERTFRTST